MKEWIQDHYPGTKLAINEYNFGELEHINGAITQADVLGIYGREVVDVACLWAPPESQQPGAFAFRMYRNYDGSASAGRRFGETVLSANSADTDLVSVFAANRDSDGSSTIVLINKTADPLITPITIANVTDAVAEVNCYDESRLDRIVRFGDMPIYDGAATITLPPNSITMLEVLEVSSVPTQPAESQIEIDDESGQRSRIRTLDVPCSLKD